MSLAASESDADIDTISMAIQDVTAAAFESDTAACLDGGDFAVSLLVGDLEGVPSAWGMATSQHNEAEAQRQSNQYQTNLDICLRLP